MEHRYLLGYKVLCDADLTPKGVPQFWFICEKCGKRRFKSTVDKLYKRGKCTHNRKKIAKKKEIPKIITKKEIQIDVIMARRMAKFMTINRVATILGITKDELLRVL